jgi:beta-N-acetylhexosaminidase
MVGALRAGTRAGAILFRRNLPDLRAAFEACRRLAGAAAPELPAWIALDQEGGRVQRLRAPFLELPSMRVLAETGNAAFVRRCTAMVGAQLAALGFNLNFAPVLDVDTNPANPVIADRSFSREPVQVARLGTAFADGLRDGGVLACGKHFPGHGDTVLDSHLALPRVDATLARLRAVELVPFVAAIHTGIPCLMTAHIVCERLQPRVPATLSRRVVTELLRGELAFEGVVFSDDLEMKAIAASYPVAEAAVAAVEAGCDVVLICSDEELQDRAHEALVRRAEQDPEFLARCRQAASRSLRARYKVPGRIAATFADVERRLHAAEATAMRAALDQGRGCAST